MKYKKVLAASVLVAAMLVSTLGLTLMQGRSAGVTEPASLSDINNYPGVEGTNNVHELNETEINTEITNLELHGTVRGNVVDGAFQIKEKLIEKGYITSFFDISFDVFVDIHINSPDGLEFQMVTAFKGWSRTSGPNGTKALVAGAVMWNQNRSIIMATITNVLPPEQLPGFDPFIIWNAEPVFIVDMYWWVPWPWSKAIYWTYWWYDSHKAPNWFWGVYWGWRTYTRYYYVTWHWWYWWWWSWYYWRCWYGWSTYWPY